MYICGPRPYSKGRYIVIATATKPGANSRVTFAEHTDNDTCRAMFQDGTAYHFNNRDNMRVFAKSMVARGYRFIAR